MTDCKDYTFEDQTSDGSPSMADCMDIINNIEGTSGEWNTGIGSQREIASAGSCKFGVQNSGTTGDVTFMTGSQDIVNIINEAVKNLGRRRQDWGQGDHDVQWRCQQSEGYLGSLLSLD